MTSFLRLVAILLAIAGLARPVGAQVVAADDRGWIGISVEVLTLVDEGRERSTVIITDVGPGSPASQAGLRPGDVLLSLNGIAWSEEFGHITNELRPGDPVTVSVEREGARRTFRFEAGTRPVQPVVANTWSLTIRADTMVERMYRAMDSLRIRLVTEGGATGLMNMTQLADSLRGLVVMEAPPHLRLSGREQVRAAVLPPGGGENRFLIDDEVRPPFGFYVFGRGDDSLRVRMQELNQEIRQLRIQESARLQELARSLPAGQRRLDTQDAELVRIRRDIEETDRRAAALRSAMERVTWEGARATVVRSPRSSGDEAVATDATGFGPLSPYVLGQNRALGAEVVELRPELAEYFDVDGGVLVVDVPAGTPAAAAGIQPGDVLIRVGSNSVRSIQQMRFALERGGEEMPLTLIRKGAQIQVLLRR